MKKCTKCKIEKDTSEFYPRKDAKGGLRSRCKTCMLESRESCKNRKQDTDKARYASNREKKLEQVKSYYESNKDKVKAYHKSILPQKMEKRRKRYREDVNYKLTCNLRSRLRMALKRNKKTAHTLELLGCSIDELKKHIESKFQGGMTWEKLMSGEIHVDHIIPCAAFNLSKPEEQQKCFHFTNLQPLWAIDNFKKSYKII